MAIPERKKLIEIAIPLPAINAASAREKSIRHGHPSTLHLWWARRPLASCRAVLFASLVDDPSHDPMFAGDEDLAATKRAELFNLMEDLVTWENSNNAAVLDRARAEIARSIVVGKLESGDVENADPVSPGATAYDIKHMLAKPEDVNAFLAEYGPAILDPFCGGGSIPLEAQRLGLRAYASDLNPVPVLITKALVEIPPKFAGRPPVNKPSERDRLGGMCQGTFGLAEDVRYYGKWIRNEAETRIGKYYPKIKITKEMAKGRADLRDYVDEELTVIAWLWARTVPSPNPAARAAHVPLVRSYWLSNRKGKEAYVRPLVDEESNSYRFEVRMGSPENGFDPSRGTVGRNGARCLISQSPIPLEYVREQGKQGKLDMRLLAIVAEGKKGRVYLPPTTSHEKVAREVLAGGDVLGTSLPDEALGFRVQNYGLTRHSMLFTSRQLLALTTFSDLVQEVCKRVEVDSKGDREYAHAIATYLAFAVGRGADKWASLTVWNSIGEKIEHVFGRNALSMTWDFPEGNVFSESTGNWESGVEWIAKVIEMLPTGISGAVQQMAAQNIPTDRAYVLSTDPPYYDNVPYADLSDFFYVWLRRTLSSIYPQLLSTVLVPKADELVADPFRHGGREEARLFFEHGMAQVFQRARDVCESRFPTTIFYGFKQAESEHYVSNGDDSVTPSRSSSGWETFLQGLLDADWQIVGTWPIRTERPGRLRDQLSNALASSVVLVCRARDRNAESATRKEVISALRRELPAALEGLQHGNIAPVDLAQAAIGPGMAVFTRYAKVMEADGTAMSVRTALGIINQVLDEVLAEQEGEFDGDTRWAVAWFEQFGMGEGPFGVAETLSKAKNTAVNGLVEAGVIAARGGKVKLVGRGDLPDDWNPAADRRLTVWETTQHLIKTLETKGESEAADLMNRLGGMAETARDLAYRLYAICERKKWAEEALAYNTLVIAWPELSKLAHQQRSQVTERQGEMF